MFTRTLLTTAAATLALIAGLSNPQGQSSPLPPLADIAFRVGWCSLCLSVLVGLALQWVAVMTPLKHAHEIEKLEALAVAQTEQTAPVVFRRLPLKRQTYYLHCQVLFFCLAFAGLTTALMLR